VIFGRHPDVDTNVARALARASAGLARTSRAAHRLERQRAIGLLVTARKGGRAATTPHAALASGESATTQLAPRARAVDAHNHVAQRIFVVEQREAPIGVRVASHARPQRGAAARRTRCPEQSARSVVDERRACSQQRANGAERRGFRSGLQRRVAVRAAEVLHDVVAISQREELC